MLEFRGGMQDYRAVKRGKVFTEKEKLHLYQCMLPDLELIDNKGMDSVTVVRKAEAWRRVTVKFNSDPTVCQRTTEQLKKCFENAKCRKQWVVDSGTGMLQPSSNPRNANKVQRNGVPVSSTQENAIKFQVYAHNPDIEQQLDIIKCELVDIADNSEDFPDDSGHPLTTVETQVPVHPSATEYIDETGQSEYRGQQSLLEERLNSNNDGTDDDLEDVTGSLFADQSIYRPGRPEVYRAPRKRVRRRADVLESDGELANDDTQIHTLEERLLKAQVREAEAAASAAQLQLQLNQLALQHAQAEEARRKQLHILRVRRLNQLLGDPHGQDG